MAEARTTTASEEEIDREIAFRLIESDVHLRRFLSRYLFGACAVQNSTFHADPILSAYNQGQRDAGLNLVRELDTVNPLLAATMQMEFANVSLSEE